MQHARGKRSVAVGGDAGIVVTGDHNRIEHPGTAVRSAYWEQVRRIAPAELVDREEELASLAAFCRADSGPAYAWWRAEAWAGKTALLSWFALNPPPGVRIVPFFITARLGAQNDAVAFVDVVLEQLAELAGEGLPALLTAATREAHLLRLYRVAAEACAARGERLILLVDGLDEDRGVTTGPEAHSIASLLPDSLRVIVSGRLNPPLPVDVPPGHPLHDPAIVRILEPSESARAIRAEAERELKHLVEAGGVAYDLLALLLAAGGGLTADDLAELTDEVPYRVRDILRTGPGRTFAVRSGAYLLAHEELQVQAEEMLRAREVDRWRGRLHAWAEEWRGRGWPEATPGYLLRGYFPMLRAAGELERMVACALDDARHDRMLEETGGDVLALDEIRVTEEAYVGAGVPGLVDLIRLVIQREELVGRNDRIPRTLPWAWAALGRIGRAEALARSIPSLDWRALALVDVAERLFARGDGEHAVRLLEDAEEAALRDPYVVAHERDRALAEVSRAWADAGHLGRAERVAEAVEDADVRVLLVPVLAEAWARDGDVDRAEALCLRERDERVRALGIAAVAGARAAEGDLGRALRLVETEGTGGRCLGLARVAGELLGAGRRTAAAEMLLRVDTLLGASPLLPDVVEALAEAGEYERAESAARLHADPEASDWALRRVVQELADRGECRRAQELAARLEDARARASAMISVVTGVANSGSYARAEEIARAIDDQRCRELALNRVVVALVQAGETDRAERLARGCAHEAIAKDPVEFVVEALARAGDFPRGRALAQTVARDDGGFALVRGAVAAAEEAGAETAGDVRERAAELVAEVEAEVRASGRGGTLDPVHTAKILAELGYLEQARELLKDVEAEVGPADGAPLGVFESTGWQVRANFAVEALAWVGEFDRALALARRLSFDPPSYMARLAIVERLGHAGLFESALTVIEDTRPEGRDDLWRTLVSAAADAGDWETAESCVNRVGMPEFRAAAWGRIAAERARAGHREDAEAAFAHAVSQDVPDAGASLEVFSDVIRFFFLLGRHAEGDEALDELVRDSPPWYASALVSALVQVGEYDRAQRLVARTDGQGHHSSGLRNGLIRDLLDAGEGGRAAAEARIAVEREAVGDGDRGLNSIWPAAALAVESKAGRVHLARRLQHMDLLDALPALLRLEPRALPVVLDALRRARQV
ncbi:hypothetical protein [Streptomyces sp. NPDC046712]|uniref:tetratricopeptide repeat protein n=1 Tax=Streptomyces sp. NPDC046712 TaxID=3154802 RepID=UPI0033CB3232